MDKLKAESLGRMEKAWRLVKDSLEDETAYHKLRKGFPVNITGSEGTLFILYPSGRFVKVGVDEAKLGKIIKGSTYASPDYLASIISWIRFDEKRLEENWGCGTFSLEESISHRPQRNDYGGYTPRHSGFKIESLVIPLMLCVAVVVVFPIIFPQINSMFGLLPETVANTTATTNSTSLTEIFSEPAQLLITLFPIILFLAFVFPLINRIGRGW